ncbi:hypothetical protein AB833_25345 [Chromatiales bacterium (ex Bugula neritina AB1)]|nr:hypothetical protein AB833_25345 [Chromatiales bacterium (ex Bugula neritina AB1)]
MVSKLLIPLTLATSLIAAANSYAADYVIDKKGQHAFVSFKASHLGYSYIVGRFNDFDGTFSHDADNPAASKVEVTINANSIDSNHQKRDDHLRSDDFLDVEKYPTITFASTSYETSGDNNTLNGDLTIHGVTQAVSIDVEHIGEGKDPWGGYRSGFEGNVTVKASDYGLPEWVGDIEVELVVEGIRQ